MSKKQSNQTRASRNASASAEMTDSREQFRRVWTVTRMGIIGLYRSQLPRMSAALAYRTIFSIIPVMAIGLLIFGSLVSEQQVESGVRRVLDFAGVSQISTTQPIDESTDQPTDLPTGDSQPDPEPALDDPNAESDAPQQVSEQASDAAAQNPAESDPFAGADLEEVITDLINRVNTSIRNVPTGWIALTSGLVLLYAAMSMLIEIEKSFNQICGAPSGRPWLRRIMLYWTILTAGSILLAATFLAGDAFTRWVVSIAGQDSAVGAVMAGYGVSVLISTVLLLGAYTTIPNTRIHFRTALGGAFFAALIWELGKLGFTAYLHYSTNYAKFYGSVAILPLFLMWVYLTWLIVLFGMQATFALQNFSRLVESKLKAIAGEQSQQPTLLDPLVMLAVARLVEDSFKEGKPAVPDEIADQTKLQASQVVELLEAMTRAGILNRVEQGQSSSGWTPARPAEQIQLSEILRCAQSLDAYRTSQAEDLIPDRLNSATIGACSGMTLADFSASEQSQTKTQSPGNAGI